MKINNEIRTYFNNVYNSYLKGNNDLGDLLQELSELLPNVSRKNINLVKQCLDQGSFYDLTLYLSKETNNKEYLYIGPMTCMENKPFEPGLIYFRKRGELDPIVDLVESNLVELGNLIFGTPLDLWGRRVEFHDLNFSIGPFSENKAKYIALFLPFYLSHPNQDVDFFKSKRTILFINLIESRFKEITKKISYESVIINSDMPLFLKASDDEVREAIALWLVLHETCHGSGPFPLFKSPLKINLKLEYAAIEEMRTDMTVWVCLEKAKKIFGKTGVLAQEIILCERVIRSSQVGLKKYNKSGLIFKSSDAENGALWANYLYNKGGLNLENNQLIINTELVFENLKEILAYIYEQEAKALRGKSKQILKDLAYDIRSEAYIKNHDKFTYHENLLRFYEALSR